MFRFVLSFVVLASPAFAGSPIAEILCEPRDRMEQRLSQTFIATRSALGVRSPDQVMEVWTDARGDWALVMRYANGQSCIVAMGEDWMTVVPAS